MSPFFHDIYNPAPEELRAWSYATAEPEWPVEDWDLMVTTRVNAPMILMLASDDANPQQRFFLSCLYLLVGDMVRTYVRDARRRGAQTPWSWLMARLRHPHPDDDVLNWIDLVDRPAPSSEEWEWLRQFLENADLSHNLVRLWHERTLFLLDHPDTYRYADWCLGRLAYSDETTT